MFLGTYTRRSWTRRAPDPPCAVPRRTSTAGLVVTRTQERALAVYPKETFEEMLRPVLNAPHTVKQVRDYQRMLTAGASFEVPDKQGRVTIPPLLRTYAGLDRDVVVIGAGSHAEIWDAETWHNYSDANEDTFAGIWTSAVTDFLGGT